MTTKTTTFRFQSETLEQIDYLARLTGQSGAKVVAELVRETVYWILEWAAAHGLDDTPELSYRNGTLLSLEEQQAIHQLGMIRSPLGEDLWAHRHDAPER